MYYGETLSTSAEFEWTVTVKNDNGGNNDSFEISIPSGFSVSPANGSKVSSISSITISDSFMEYESFAAKKDSFDISINGNKVSVGATTTDTSITLTLSEPLKTPEQYNIEVPAGVFTYEDFYWNTYENVIFRWVVTIGDNSDEPEPDKPTDPEMPENNVIPSNFSVDPEDGETVAELSVITIEATRWNEIETVDGTLLYINGVNVEYTAKTAGEDSEFLIITLTTPIKEDGEYTIFVPKGFFNYYGDLTSSAFKWTVFVDSSYDPEDPDPEQPEDPTIGETYIPAGFHVSPEPDSEVDAIDSITITTDYSDIYLPNELTSIKVNGIPTAVTATANWDTMTITLTEEITEPGYYTIVIPAGSFRWADTVYEDSETFTFTLHVKGNGTVSVKDIALDDDATEVYTINGIRVKEIKPRQVYIVKARDHVFRIMTP
ncbi:MAG: hypothetical protein K2O47_01285 [Muribaculaceae bacterium]|nr:hypothetical protein [Muribaculaceae bacterium]